MKSSLKAIVFVSLFFTFHSCKKDFTSQNESETTPSKKFYLPSTEAEKKFVEEIKVAKEIIKEVYKDKEALKEVNAFIAAHVYREENAFLKDLLNPYTSNAYEAKQLKPYLSKFKKGAFAQKFKEVLDEYNGQRNATARGVLQYYYQLFATSDITIYFPYSKNFISTPADFDNLNVEDISLCAADRDADEEIGDEPEVINQMLTYKDVLINDDYSQINAVNIIGKNDKNNTIYLFPFDDTDQGGSGGSGNGNDPFEKKNNYDLPGRRVYLGWAKCSYQYDAFISFTGNGGGSEIMYSRGSGYLEMANNSVSNFNNQISSYFSRGDIKHGFWQKIYGIWDVNWESDDLQQVLGIWEEDTKGSINFTGSLTTTVNLGNGSSITASIGFNITRQSQDAIIRQLNWKRNDYLATVTFDQGCGFKYDQSFGENWPVYDCGANVSWTFPVMTY